MEKNEIQLKKTQEWLLEPTYHMWVCWYINHVTILKNREDIWLLHTDLLYCLILRNRKICILEKDLFFRVVQKIQYDDE